MLNTMDTTPSLRVLFGFGTDALANDVPDLLRLTHQADDDGLDLFSLPDHPYLAERLDAYATIGFVLGTTRRLGGLVNVTNLPARPAPVLARTITSLSALSGGRVVLGAGAGGRWDRIADLGVKPLSPGDAVDAFEEAITLIRMLSGGGPPVTFQGRYHQVHEITPAAAATPRVWTGSVGRKSLAATGRVADGWIPGHAADWLSPRYRDSRPVIDDAAAAAGRDPSQIRTVYNLPGQITARPSPATRGQDGRWLGGSPSQWIEELTSAVLKNHAGGFILFSPTGGTPDPTTLATWAQEITPAVREAASAA
jgi:alkanesulfonate monooxygenase SsuD/methylene tetrahydromethanopterin reductase-like flavin-dependent oxidoreductase (luciferase family)